MRCGVFPRLQSAFGLSAEIAGLSDAKTKVIYPLSTVCARPANFTSEYEILFKRSTAQAQSQTAAPPIQSRQAWGDTKTDGVRSNGTAVPSNTPAVPNGVSASNAGLAVASELELLQRRSGCTSLGSFTLRLCWRWSNRILIVFVCDV